MAKKTAPVSEPTVAETVNTPTSNELAFPNDDALTVDGSLSVEKTLAAFGYEADAFKFDPEAPPHFWVPAENTALFGIVIGEFVYTKTKLTDSDGNAKPLKSYVLQLTKPAVARSAESKEDEMLEPGDTIGFADRAAAAALQGKEGKEVCILCYKKIPLSNGKTFWKMRIGIAKE